MRGKFTKASLIELQKQVAGLTMIASQTAEDEGLMETIADAGATIMAVIDCMVANIGDDDTINYIVGRF